jgi:hypothetical protein
MSSMLIRTPFAPLDAAFFQPGFGPFLAFGFPPESSLRTVVL